jgi:hypothetical protein
MTIREYITAKFKAWNVSEVQFLDLFVTSGIDVDLELTTDNVAEVNKAIIPLVEELMLSPTVKSISENGFSLSWDYSNIGRYYMWLCRKFGVDPNDEVVAALGISTVTDKTDIW